MDCEENLVAIKNYAHKIQEEAVVRIVLCVAMVTLESKFYKKKGKCRLRRCMYFVYNFMLLLLT